MKPGSLIVAFGLLAGIDFVAVLLWQEWWHLPGLEGGSSGLVGHLLVVLAATLLLPMFPANAGRPGRWLLGLLAGLLTLVCPVAGPLAAGLLAGLLSAPAKPPQSRLRLVLGNPARDDRVNHAPPVHTPVREPFAHLLRAGPVMAQWLVVPLLRQSRSPSGVGLLRLLASRGDARTQLYAQGALGSLLDASEQEIQALQSKHHSGEASPTERERLAAILLHSARSGIFPGDHSRTLFTLASEVLGELVAEYPEDPALLHELARCRIEQGELSGVPDLFQRLQGLVEGSRLSSRLETAFYHASGKWQLLTEAAGRAAADGAPLSYQSREFWLTRRPVRRPVSPHA